MSSMVLGRRRMLVNVRSAQYVACVGELEDVDAMAQYFSGFMISYEDCEVSKEA